MVPSFWFRYEIFWQWLGTNSLGQSKRWDESKSHVLCGGETGIAETTATLVKGTQAILTPPVSKNGDVQIDVKGKRPMVQLDTLEEKQRPEEKAISWEKPESGWIKVNVDASFLEN